jgi:hypothetical protein
MSRDGKRFRFRKPKGGGCPGQWPGWSKLPIKKNQHPSINLQHFRNISPCRSHQLSKLHTLKQPTRKRQVEQSQLLARDVLTKELILRNNDPFYPNLNSIYTAEKPLQT